MKNQSIKISDKLLCKKDYYSFSELVFHTNEYYFSSDKYGNFYRVCELNFCQHLFTYSQMFEYFYSESEVRKMKLKKIESCE